MKQNEITKGSEIRIALAEDAGYKMVDVVGATEKAVCVRMADRVGAPSAWFPRSALKQFSFTDGTEREGYFYVAGWFFSRMTDEQHATLGNN